MKSTTVYKPLPLFFLVLLLIQFLLVVIFMLFLIGKYCLFSAPGVQYPPSALTTDSSYYRAPARSYYSPYNHPAHENNPPANAAIKSTL